VSAVADNYGALKALDTEVLSVSVDSHFVHKMWNDHELVRMVDGGVPFPMVSDQAGNVGRAYGVYDEAQGIELRGRFLIDPDGVIQAMEVLTPPVGRMFSETVRQIRAFQLVRASGGAQATPAGWMPGQTVLEPGPDLVGRVWTVWKPTERGG
jgi:peroxiredoxin (alkyl hydroperoxide reductase subunit C)